MTSKIALIGEAYGDEEARWGKPFIGPAGQELNRLLADAEIGRDECYVTNVFNIHPPRNDLEFFLVSKRDGGGDYERPPLLPGKFLRLEYARELDRLYDELETIRPNVAVLLGNTACWAFLDQSRIAKLRGAVCYSTRLPWLKCLPAYHPAAVLRQYELRHVTVLDLVKARLESEFPDVKRPVRKIWLDPAIEDIGYFVRDYVWKCERLAVDIETRAGQITCIGFAPRRDVALVIPFWDDRKEDGNYWEHEGDERLAWQWVAQILDGPSEKIFQNGLYDMFYLWKYYGIPTRNASEDTMLLHHALHPESPKALDFLGSVYTNEVAWKTHRSKFTRTIKRED